MKTELGIIKECYENYFGTQKYESSVFQATYGVLVRGMIFERDTEWTQKIQDALDKTSNWNCKDVLTKLLEDKL